MEVESLRSKNGKSMEQPEPGSSTARGLRNRRKFRNICFGVMGVLIFIIILIVILAFTVFKAKLMRAIFHGLESTQSSIVAVIVWISSTLIEAYHKRPVTTIDSVSLANLKFSVDLARLQVLLNASLDVDLSIKNPNKVGFKYTNSVAQLNYRGQQVGEVPIPAGKISADQTVPMNLTLIVMADRLISDSKFLSDVLGRELPLNTFAKISGKVNVLNLFKIHVVSSTSCDFTVFLSNSSVGDQDCKYKTKF